MSVVTPRRSEIAEWTLALPAGWYPVPLEPLDAHGVSMWIDEIVGRVNDEADAPGSPTALRDELADVRSRALHLAEDETLRMAVSIRPEVVMTVGSLFYGSVVVLDDDEGPDELEALMRDAFDHPGRGVRTHQAMIWRDVAGTTAIVSGYQRLEIFELGEEHAPVEDRMVLGLFPEGCRHMLRFEFRTRDILSFEDMPADTMALAQRAQIDLRPIGARA
jgi:hypothetical protein